jgi:hypothetical protein
MVAGVEFSSLPKLRLCPVRGHRLLLHIFDGPVQVDDHCFECLQVVMRCMMTLLQPLVAATPHLKSMSTAEESFMITASS